MFRSKLMRGLVWDLQRVPAFFSWHTGTHLSPTDVREWRGFLALTLLTAASLLVGHSFRRPLPLQHGGGPSLCAACEPSGDLLVMLCCRLRLRDDSRTTPAVFLRGRLRRILVVGGWWRFALSRSSPERSMRAGCWLPS